MSAKKKFYVGTIPSELVFLQFRDAKGDPLIVKPQREAHLTEAEHVALVERVGPKFASEIRDEEAHAAWQAASKPAADDSFDDLLAATSPVAKKGK